MADTTGAGSTLVEWIVAGVTLIGGAVAWVINLFNSRLDDVEKRLDEIPDIYARRDDVRFQFERIMVTLLRIEDKLDKKVDKPGG